MTTALLELVLESVWYWYGTVFNAHQLSVMCFIFIALSVTVFIVEMRVRTNVLLTKRVR